MSETMQPDKMNLASLGNMTPHVHWHVVPRFRDDRHYSPDPDLGRLPHLAARAPVHAEREEARGEPNRRHRGAPQIERHGARLLTDSRGRK